MRRFGYITVFNFVGFVVVIIVCLSWFQYWVLFEICRMLLCVKVKKGIRLASWIPFFEQTYVLVSICVKPMLLLGNSIIAFFVLHVLFIHEVLLSPESGF
ncbi:hypothetical protein DMA11_16295 [Marinilabiliaceae bacterium JC017]|nr:hypothetical protein DMA11_16295 [Marinilabiliaceae bacterium JC017]